MNATAKSIIACAVGVVGLWLAVVILLAFGVEAVAGTGLSERLTPFNNIHLMEEAAEGAYSPLLDPPFLVHAVVVAVLVAGGTTAFLVRRVFRGRPFVAVVPTLFLVVLLAALWNHVWLATYPSSMRDGVVLQFGLFIGAAMATAIASRNRGADV